MFSGQEVWHPPHARAADEDAVASRDRVAQLQSDGPTQKKNAVNALATFSNPGDLDILVDGFYRIGFDDDTQGGQNSFPDFPLSLAGGATTTRQIRQDMLTNANNPKQPDKLLFDLNGADTGGNPIIFADGFESGDTSAWSAPDVPCQRSSTSRLSKQRSLSSRNRLSNGP